MSSVWGELITGDLTASAERIIGLLRDALACWRVSVRKLIDLLSVWFWDGGRERLLRWDDNPEGECRFHPAHEVTSDFWFMQSRRTPCFFYEKILVKVETGKYFPCPSTRKIIIRSIHFLMLETSHVDDHLIHIAVQMRFHQFAPCLLSKMKGERVPCGQFTPWRKGKDPVFLQTDHLRTDIDNGRCFIGYTEKQVFALK